MDVAGVRPAAVHADAEVLKVPDVQGRRWLQLKATFESSLPCLSFKRGNQAGSTWGQPGVKLHGPTDALLATHVAARVWVPAPNWRGAS